MVTCGSWQP